MILDKIMVQILSWAIDIEYFRYQKLEESGLDHVQTPNTRGCDLITTVYQRETVEVRYLEEEIYIIEIWNIVEHRLGNL
jgi:hypothetical protein